MSAATLTLKTPTAPIAREAPAKTETKVASQRKPWYARWFDAMVEARMRQAEREVERYLLISAPYYLREKHAGKFGTYDDVGVRFMR